MRRTVLSAAAALLLTGVQPSHAEPLARTEPLDGQAEREFKEGLEKILRAFDLMLRSVPQYAKPEVLENGDIVIRRKPPRPTARPAPSRDAEWT